MSEAHAVRWWSVRPAEEPQARDLYLPVLRPVPARDQRAHAGFCRRATRDAVRHAHTACALAARKAGRLPSRDEWLATLKATSKAAAPTNGAPAGEEGAETNGFAIASMFLGIIWLFGIGSIVAIILGYAGMKQIDASGGHQSGRAIAIAGIVIGIVGLASMGILVGFLLSSSHNAPLIPGPNS